MLESIISEGKTTTEAIEKGLKQLNASKDMVEINVLENTEKRSFFSILTPRIVKVEIKLKDKIVKKNKEKQTNIIENLDDIDERKEKIVQFLEQLKTKISQEEFNYRVEVKDNTIMVDIYGDCLGFLIGYRGETLNSLQIILSSIANNDYKEKVKVMLDIQAYREKRKVVLEELAVKVSKSVLKTGKSITLEPMSAYERKIIHNKLQENKKVSTHSVGEEPHRRVVISKNN